LTQSIFYSDNNDICEAVGCFAEATTKVDVKVGLKETITLNLYVNCINKFDQKGTALERVQEPFSNTNQSVQPLSKRGRFKKMTDMNTLADYNINDIDKSSRYILCSKCALGYANSI
jgi:hypothetical protein